MRTLAIVAALAVACSVALAQKGGAGAPETGIDWAAGVIARPGAAAADLRAPSPAVARVTAEREALERAREALREAARELRLADGTAVGEAADGDPDAAARLERALARVRPAAIDYGSDGSVALRAALPLEAVRLAVRGPSPARPLQPTAPTAVIVDARGAKITPALGMKLSLGGVDYEGPTVFHAGLAAARADPRLGPRPAQAKASGARAGTIELAAEGDFDSAALGRARDAGALVCVVLGQ